MRPIPAAPTPKESGTAMPSPDIARTSLCEVPVSSPRSTQLYANKPHSHSCCANRIGPFRGFLPYILVFKGFYS
jgi:hypothetical protein